MDRQTRTDRARLLRQEATEAERKLWSIVRSRRLGGFKFRRQVPVDRYIADFVCMDAKLIVELDGGQHADQAEYDAGRTEVLEASGFRVVRFWNRQVLGRESVVGDAILRELRLTK